MKKLILGVVVMFIATMTMAQSLPINEKTGKVTFMDVIETGTVTAAEAKNVMTKWASRKVFSTTVDEQTRTFYKGKHKVSYPAARGGTTVTGDVGFTLQFFYKDGKFRYIMTDFVHVGRDGNGGKIENKVPKVGYGKIKEKSWSMIKNQTLKASEAMVKEFTDALKEFQNDPARSDDW